jgi:hypothetical protein
MSGLVSFCRLTTPKKVTILVALKLIQNKFGLTLTKKGWTSRQGQIQLEKIK